MLLLSTGCGSLKTYYEDKYLDKAADEAEVIANKVYDEREQEKKAKRFDEMFGTTGIYGWGGTALAMFFAQHEYRKRKNGQVPRGVHQDVPGV